MWPEINQLLNEQQLNDYAFKFEAELAQFIESENLDASFALSFKSVFIPLAKWIESKQVGAPLVLGVNGAQGSGKSTLCKLLVMLLGQLFNKTVLHLSIDDLYLSPSQRQQLANEIHPLLKVRGVPGTHNVELGIELLKSIKDRSAHNLKIPVFDKTIDDLLPEEQWVRLVNNIDIVLFEGWCVAALPQQTHELKDAINQLEKKHDIDGIWRQYVNQKLSSSYAKLFSYIDYLVMLKVPQMQLVFEWRNLQEQKLKLNSDTHDLLMSEAEIKHFIMYFERITRNCLQEMPQRADVVLALNKQHEIVSVDVK